MGCQFFGPEESGPIRSSFPKSVKNLAVRQNLHTIEVVGQCRSRHSRVVHHSHEVHDYREKAMLENTEEAEMHFQKAVSHFKVVIDTYPKSKAHEPAQYYLGVTYAIKGNFEDAIAMLEKLSHHAKDKNVRQNAEAMLERVKDLASSN